MKKFNNYFDTTKKRSLVVISVVFILVLMALFYYKLDSLFSISIPCIFHKITKLYCPGCGITRAFFSLMEFDIIAAIKYNLLIILVFPFLGYYIFINVRDWIFFKERNYLIFNNRVWNFLLIITILFGIQCTRVLHMTKHQKNFLL